MNPKQKKIIKKYYNIRYYVSVYLSLGALLILAILNNNTYTSKVFKGIVGVAIYTWVCYQSAKVSLTEEEEAQK